MVTSATALSAISPVPAVSPESSTTLPQASLAKPTRPSPPETSPSTKGADGHSTGADTSPEDILNQLNADLQAWSTGMRFDLDEDTGRIVVSIIDAQSGEVVRSIPNETVMRIAKMIVTLQGRAIDVSA